ncbi:hypothetical protein SAY87_024594 [Trapa incisa]|uniref:Uncharacterized protein n=1 Tax=Trapa incisa TaxID=236973 RepID=A0AAN7J8S9_9MYRT|nr:hypothetical protein SAY87_024594 [Trapa incisa]
MNGKQILRWHHPHIVRESEWQAVAVGIFGQSTFPRRGERNCIGLIDPLERERDGLGNGVMGDNHSTQSLASSQRANCRTKKESDAGWRVKLGLFFRYRYPIPSPKLY